MKAIMLLFSFAICSSSAHAQGAWDIKYLPLYSLKNSLIGKEIRIDFKGNKADTLVGEVDTFEIRNLLFRQDTISLVVGGERMQFVEQWKVYADHGVVNEQYLQGIGKENPFIELRKMVFGEIDPGSLTLIATVKNKNGKWEEQLVLIARSKIKGVLVRSDDWRLINEK